MPFLTELTILRTANYKYAAPTALAPAFTPFGSTHSGLVFIWFN
jgi:hypothetical protein